jgi:hypothetical protein
MKDAPRENFRWAAHTGGIAVVKPKDYEVTGEIEAPTPYAAWKLLAAAGEHLQTGDLLETSQPNGEAGELQIAKYIGFEPARWYVPEPKPESGTLSTDTSSIIESTSHLS